MLRGFIGDPGKNLPSCIVLSIAGIIAIPMITHLFPPSDYGDYLPVMAAVSVLAVVHASWIATAIIRVPPICQLNNRQSEFYITTVILIFISVGLVSLVGSGLLFLIQNQISSNLVSLVRLGLLIFIATSFYNAGAA